MEFFPMYMQYLVLPQMQSPQNRQAKEHFHKSLSESFSPIPAKAQIAPATPANASVERNIHFPKCFCCVSSIFNP